MGPKEAPAMHVTLHKFAPKLKQAIDWPHLNFIVFFILFHDSGNKNQAKTRSGYGATNFQIFPLCPLCVSHSPAFSVPLPQI
jgi:hypothetical protein